MLLLSLQEVIFLIVNVISETTKITTEAEWHNVKFHPYDLPSQYEKVLVTIEPLDGCRRVIPEAYIKYSDDEPVWCKDYFNSEKLHGHIILNHIMCMHEKKWKGEDTRRNEGR